jgi:hypothetical protein
VTRTWRMFASRSDNPDRPFQRFGDERIVRFCGLDPVEVELVEDPDGPCWGYIQLTSVLTDWEPSGVPVMVQPHRGMFFTQSPDGFEGAVRAGRGEIVRMSCREVES